VKLVRLFSFFAASVLIAVSGLILANASKAQQLEKSEELPFCDCHPFPCKGWHGAMECARPRPPPPMPVYPPLPPKPDIIPQDQLLDRRKK
jgi:hypothetical protein